MSHGSGHDDRSPGGDLPSGVARRRVQRWTGDGCRTFDDALAEEVPVAIHCNGQPFAVMMATPADIADFARGFAWTERLVERPDESVVEQVHAHLEGIVVQLRIPEARAAALADRKRSLEGRSGCGICGSRQLEDVLRPLPPVQAALKIEVQALRRALGELRQAQAINRLTGATHAAGWAGPDGRLQVVREDVGRHNALDKLVGALLAQSIDPSAGFIVVTSRASYEMAMKAVAAGVGLLAAISAPTALAVSLAESANLTLIGFARDDGHAVYTHPQRLPGGRSPEDSVENIA